MVNSGIQPFQNLRRADAPEGARRRRERVGTRASTRAASRRSRPPRRRRRARSWSATRPASPTSTWSRSSTPRAAGRSISTPYPTLLRVEATCAALPAFAAAHPDVQSDAVPAPDRKHDAGRAPPRKFEDRAADLVADLAQLRLARSLLRGEAMTKTPLFLLLPLLAAACGGSSLAALGPARDRAPLRQGPGHRAGGQRRGRGRARRRQPRVRDRHAQALRASQAGNFIFSQTSISTALAMLYAGAATTTAAEMAATLHFTLPPERLHAAFNALDLALTRARGSDAAAFRLGDRQLDLGAGRFRGAAQLPRHAGPELRRRAVRRGLRRRCGGRAPEDQRLGLRSHRGSDPGAVPAGRDQRRSPGWCWPTRSSSTATGRCRSRTTAPNETFHALSGDVSVPTMHGDRNAALWNGTGWNAAALEYVGARRR